MFQFRNRKLSEQDSTIDFRTIEEAKINYKDCEDSEPPWYKRIFVRLVNWVKQKRKRMREKSLMNPMKEMFKLKQKIEKNGRKESDFTMKHKQQQQPEEQIVRSLEDIPRNQLGINITKSASAGEPSSNDSWKDDAQLMLNGSYSRFKMVPIFKQKYNLISLIGQGSFGFVLKAERLRDFKQVAIKFIYRQSINSANWIFDSELGMIPSEVYYLRTLRHPGIIQFFDYFDDGRYVYLVSELFGTSWNPSKNKSLNPKRNPGIKCDVKKSDDAPCDLFECIEAHKNLPEATIHYIFKQLLDVVGYLASQGIVHRDLKDENVVVDADYRIKIVDFGCAARIPLITGREEGWFEKFNGTLAFAPPEVIRGQKYRGSEAEIWTLGVLLYTMAFRETPFPNPQTILTSQLEFPFEEDTPGKHIKST